MNPALIEYNKDLSGITCMDTFLQSLALTMNTFAQAHDGLLFFTQAGLDSEIQAFIDNFDCAAAEAQILEAFPPEYTGLVYSRDPKIDDNLEQGMLCLNKETGSVWMCMDETPGENIYKSITSPGGYIKPIPRADRFDFFEDNSAVAFYQFNGDIADVGGKYPGEEDGNIRWEDGLEGSCADSSKTSQIIINNLPFDNTTGAVTIGAWFKWTGKNNRMPFGFGKYSLLTYKGQLGFHTGSGDLRGFDFNYSKTWVYVITIFKKGQVGKIYVKGIPQTLGYSRGTFKTSNAEMDDTFRIFGWGGTSGYRDFGSMERLRLINREITDAEALDLATAEMEFIESLTGKQG